MNYIVSVITDDIIKPIHYIKFPLSINYYNNLVDEVDLFLPIYFSEEVFNAEIDFAWKLREIFMKAPKQQPQEESFDEILAYYANFDIIRELSLSYFQSDSEEDFSWDEPDDEPYTLELSSDEESEVSSVSDESDYSSSESDDSDYFESINETLQYMLEHNERAVEEIYEAVASYYYAVPSFVVFKEEISEEQLQLQPTIAIIDYFDGKRLPFKPILISKFNRMNLQSLSSDFMGYLAHDFYLQQTNEELICLFEDVCTFIYMASAGNSSFKVRLPIAVATFIKLRMKGSLINSIYSVTQECCEYIEEIFAFPSIDVGNINDMNLQADFGLDSLNAFFDKYDELCNSPIFCKLYKLLFFLLSIVIYKKYDMNFVKSSYLKNEKEAFLQNLQKGPDFVISFVKTVTFICQRGYQCMVTGSLDPIYHNGDKYEAWMNQVIDCKRNHKFINNPEAHGFTKFEFINKLNKLITEGEAMYRHAARVGEFERKFIYSYLSDLKNIHSIEMTKKAAMKYRDAPFSLLIFGGSKLAKSQFTELIFQHFGKISNLPTSYEYKYTRTFSDEYWSNFDSSQWCLQMDDVSFMHPNVAPNGDPSVMELLQVVNNVPYIPPQAAIEDKGKNPVLCRLVIATTNVEHLNAMYYFNSELAVRRRLPFVIRLYPKQQYTSDNVTLNTNLLPVLNEGEYPDFWIIEICEVIPAGIGNEEQRAGLRQLHRFDSIYMFVRWLNIEARNHTETQNNASSCANTIRNVTLCDGCHMPLSHCDCVRCPICHMTPCICEFQTDFYQEISIYYIKFLLCTAWFWSSLTWYIPCLDKSEWANRFTNYLLDLIGRSSAAHYSRFIGNKVEDRLKKRKFLVRMVAALACGAITYKIFRAIRSRHNGKNQNDGAPVTKEERPNPWSRPDYEVTQFDYNKMQTSYKALSTDEVLKKIGLNCAAFHFTWHQDDGKEMNSRTRAFCIRGNIYIVNKHAVSFNGSAQLSVILHHGENISSNTKCLVHKIEFISIENTDLYAIEIDCVPPRKDLTHLFAKESFNGSFDGMYVGRTQSGKIVTNALRKLRLLKGVHNENIEHSVDVWSGYSEELTVPGDCGSVSVMFTTNGPMLLGFHMLGNPDLLVASQRLTFEQIVELLETKMPKQFEPSEIKFHEDITNMRFENKLHWKSPCYDTKGSATVYGSMRGYFGNTRSAVVDSPLRNQLREYNITTDARAPNLTDPRAWQLNLNAIMDCQNAFSKPILQICAAAYVADIIKLLPESEGKLCQILDDDTTLNGKPGVTYIDALNKNTSMGYPWNRSKRFYLKPLNSNDVMKRDFQKFDDIVYDMMNEMVENYNNGFLNHPIFMGSTKDEPVSESKYLLGKVRVFTGSNCAYSMLVRKHYLSFIRVFQRNPYIFEGAPGMICQSLEWEKLREYLTTFGDDGDIDGDFEKYDKVVMALFVKTAFWIIHQIQNYFGQGEVSVREGLALDTAYPMVIFKGDLIQFHNMLCSGIPLTVIINCIVNSLYMRYCYYIIFQRVDNFKDYVKLMTYGDDNVQNVHPSIRDKYNHVTIAKILKASGVNYTMADKSSDITPFRNINQISFLKRSFRWDEDIGAYLAPLEIKSIHKMLCVNMISRTISLEQVTIASVSSAMRELFFHGKEIFTEYERILRQVVHDADLDNYIESSTFPSYELLKQQFWENSKHVVIIRDCIRPKLSGQEEPKGSSSISDLQDEENSEPLCLSVLMELLTHQGVPQSLFLENPRLVGKFGSRLLGEGAPRGFKKSPDKKQILKRALLNAKIQADEVTSQPQTFSIPMRMRGGGGQQSTSSRLRGTTTPNGTEADAGEIRDQPSGYQTGNGGGYYGHRTIEQSQTVRFLDDSLPNFKEYQLVNDPDTLADTTVGMDLGNYLSRPVQLGSFAWTGTAVAGDSLATFEPWDDWLSNAQVSAKISGWAFIRGTLKLKFLTNASPFLYGAARVAYTPLQNWRPSNYNFATTTQSLIPFSQLPGAWIFPQANQGCELSLPFLTPFNLLDIRNDQITTAERIRPQDFGQIDIRVYAPLRSANGVAAPSTVVTVYCWLEDVTLSGPTLASALQADEYGEQPYSKTASAIADAAALLKGIPFISPYATATEMGARAAAKGLKAFGYSDPPVIDNQCAFRPNAYPPIASSEISYPFDKLTIDPKNELSIDPSLVGLDNTDELNIQQIVTKRSYLTSFNWVDSDLVQTNKFIVGIAPTNMMDFSALAYGQRFALTPMAWIGQLFDSWRGDIEINIKVIASKFHKGRLCISYDPAGTSVANLITTIGPYDERVATTILDLEENTEVDFIVPYQQAASWVNSRSVTSVTQPYQTSGFNWANVNPNIYGNGCLGIKVLTPLTGPVSPTTVQILVSVRGKENLEFANPLLAMTRLSTAPMQADMSDQIGEVVEEEAVVGTSMKAPSGTKYLTYFGENIVSLRQLLRRMTYVGSVDLGYHATNTRDITYDRPRYPNGGGALPSSAYLARNLAATANIPYSWEHQHLLPYIASAFCGIRGSVNWTFNVKSLTDRPITLRASRRNITGADTYTFTNIVDASDDTQVQASLAYRADRINFQNLGTGGSVTDVAVQPSVNIQLPMYTRLKFLPSHPNNFVNPGAVSNFYHGTNGIRVETTIEGGSHAKLQQYASIGTDFGLHFFLCVPLLYFYTSTPAAPV